MRLIEPNEVANLSHGPIPAHAGIIMDGSGRWASYQDLERTEGHYATRRPILDSIRVALDLKISWLSLFAFSTENWSRPETELSTLARYLADWAVTRELVDPLVRRGVRFHFIGDLNDSRIPAKTSTHFRQLAEMTADNCALELVLAYNYGGQAEIVEAARKAIKAGVDADKLDVETFESFMHLPNMPAIDLLIRTSGEQRLSNFMLWRLGYSELVFMDTLWPDFRCGHFQSAIAEYQARYRRYGSLPWKNDPR
jgi:undecaprenyl diphosphate synthase